MIKLPSLSKTISSVKGFPSDKIAIKLVYLGYALQSETSWFVPFPTLSGVKPFTLTILSDL